MKEKLRTTKGITLIALIITIIIMLLLVGVTVTIAINGGIFNTGKKAAKETQIEKDREILTAGIIPSWTTEGIDFSKLQGNLPQGWKVEDQGNKAKCTSPNNNVFIVDKYGNIKVEDGKEGEEDDKIDENPGELEEPETGVYEINSIEDLVAFSYNVNSGTKTYEGETVRLGRSLYFNGDHNSYANPDAKYEEVEVQKENSTSKILGGYIPSETSEKTIKELVRTEKGFVPIGNEKTVGTFKGTFDGQNKTLHGIYINATYASSGGLFGYVDSEITIQNLKINDGLIAGEGCVGGIIGLASATANINNCHNSTKISSRRTCRRNCRICICQNKYN